MRVMVVICGANGERSMLIEKAVEEFAPKYFDRILQFSACTVAASPILVQMSGGDPDHLVAVNGCRNRCADLILKKAGISPKVTIVLDDAVDRELGKCEACTRFVFPDIREEEWTNLARMMGEAVEKAQ
ncbi:MAG: putative zinc-binding protein [Methanomassiliicoccus sp.]|nr:putative zinc-binding protein [Methanomassiliicoccus sp.]